MLNCIVPATARERGGVQEGNEMKMDPGNGVNWVSRFNVCTYQTYRTSSRYSTFTLKTPKARHVLSRKTMSWNGKKNDNVVYLISLSILPADNYLRYLDNSGHNNTMYIPAYAERWLSSRSHRFLLKYPEQRGYPSKRHPCVCPLYSHAGRYVL